MIKNCDNELSGSNALADIEEFYRDSTILITGGTGFLGKVLVEKLIRCFSVRKIYLFIRVKNNTNVHDRLKSYFEETIFDRIRADNNGSMFEKVYPIEVDYESNDLDITKENVNLICSEVQIVFNIVASVKFNEKLKDAFNINVLGTKKILYFILKMNQLKSFVHISTLYSNCNLSYIEEKCYEPDIAMEKLIKIIYVLSDEQSVEKLNHCLIDRMPNTYTMTKKYSENLVNVKANNLPAGIFRPPIVLSTYKEPIPGWTDNLNGPSGLCMWAARGFVHCIYGDGNKKANLVPADYCINAIIATGWDVNRRFADRMKFYKPIPVYNYMYDKNNLTWGQYMRMSQKGHYMPLENSCWHFAYHIYPHKYIFYLAELFLHTIPGCIFDALAQVFHQKQIYRKGYRRLERAIRLLSYFGLREWKFQNDNIRELSNMLRTDGETEHSKTRVNLDFNIENINWQEYFRYYMFGIKKYFLKESFEKIHKIKRAQQRLYYLHTFVKWMFWILISSISVKFIRKFVCDKIIRIIALSA